MDRTITVTGSGKVAVRPDRARLEANLSGKCDRYADAVRSSEDSVSHLKGSVAATGFDPESLRTSGFSVTVVYRYVNRDGVTVSEFDGYEYTHRVRMTVDVGEDVGRLLDSLLSCEGSPEFHVSYTVSDSSTPMAEARSAAVRDAEFKAKSLAKDSNVTLGDIVSISYVSSPCNFASAKMLSSRGSEITPEDVEFNDSVTIQWEIL